MSTRWRSVARVVRWDELLRNIAVNMSQATVVLSLAAVASGLLAITPSHVHATPLSVVFSGAIRDVHDPAGVSSELAAPAGPVAGLFTLDREVGTVTFGDGTRGQRLPN